MKKISILLMLLSQTALAQANAVNVAFAPESVYGSGCPMGYAPTLTSTMENDVLKVKVSYDSSLMMLDKSANQFCLTRLAFTNVQHKQLKLISFKLSGDSFIHRAEKIFPTRLPFYMTADFSLEAIMSYDHIGVVGKATQKQRRVSASPATAPKEKSYCGATADNDVLNGRLAARVFADAYGGNTFTQFGLKSIELEFKVVECEDLNQ